jgi:hypothetical protein
VDLVYHYCAMCSRFWVYTRKNKSVSTAFMCYIFCLLLLPFQILKLGRVKWICFYTCNCLYKMANRITIIIFKQEFHSWHVSADSLFLTEVTLSFNEICCWYIVGWAWLCVILFRRLHHEWKTVVELNYNHFMFSTS